VSKTSRGGGSRVLREKDQIQYIQERCIVKTIFGCLGGRLTIWQIIEQDIPTINIDQFVVSVDYRAMSLKSINFGTVAQKPRKKYSLIL